MRLSTSGTRKRSWSRRVFMIRCDGQRCQTGRCGRARCAGPHGSPYLRARTSTASARNPMHVKFTLTRIRTRVRCPWKRPASRTDGYIWSQPPYAGVRPPGQAPNGDGTIVRRQKFGRAGNNSRARFSAARPAFEIINARVDRLSRNSTVRSAWVRLQENFLIKTGATPWTANSYNSSATGGGNLAA